MRTRNGYRLAAFALAVMLAAIPAWASEPLRRILTVEQVGEQILQAHGQARGVSDGSTALGTAVTEKTLANGLYIDGNYGFERTGGTVVMRVDRIKNDTTNSTTGTLRLELWATTTQPGRAQGFTGYRLAVGANLGQLPPRTMFTNVVSTTSFTPPPDGSYWVVLVLAEFSSTSCSTSDRFCIEDSGTFTTQTCFGSCGTPPPGSGLVTVISRQGSQCYENYPQAAFDIINQSNPGLFEAYPQSTSCAALGMSFFAGLLAIDGSVRVYTTDAATAQLLCSTGVIVQCQSTPPPPPPPPPPSSSNSAIENPAPGSYQSGIGLISGWSCQGGTMQVRVDGVLTNVVYGSGRNDTAGICGGNVNTGFGLLVNYNNFGPGTHTIQLVRNGVAVGSPQTFTVTVPSGEFMRGLTREIQVPNFPSGGRTTTLIWQESQQNFGIRSVVP